MHNPRGLHTYPTAQRKETGMQPLYSSDLTKPSNDWCLVLYLNDLTSREMIGCYRHQYLSVSKVKHYSKLHLGRSPYASLSLPLSICQSVAIVAVPTDRAWPMQSAHSPAPSFLPPSLASQAGRRSSHLKSRVSRKGSKSATDRCVPHVSPFGHVPRLEVKA